MSEEPKWQRARYLRSDDPLCPKGRLFWVVPGPPIQPGPCFKHQRRNCISYRTKHGLFDWPPVRGFYGLVHAEDVELLSEFSRMDNPDEVLDA
jgi:hypothetical protein